MLSKPEFPLLVAALAALLFSWPLVDLHAQFGPAARVGYFFVIWGLVVLAYYLWTRRLR